MQANVVEAAGEFSAPSIVNATRGTVLAESCERADTVLTRGVGLMGRQSLPAGEALVIEPCSSVHSCFMRFPIDVLFVDREGTVRHLIRNMVPWRFSKFVRKSKVVVELPGGTVDRTGTQIGDKVEIAPTRGKP